MIEKIDKYKIPIIIIICVILLVVAIMMKKNNKEKVPEIEVLPQSELIAGNNKRSKEMISNWLTENLSEMETNLEELFNRVGTNFINLEFLLEEYEFKVDFENLRHIEFYAEDNLNESIDFFDKNGNKINVDIKLYDEDGDGYNEVKSITEGIPLPQYNGKNIEISDNIRDVKNGEYFLIKYYDPYSIYTYYFISPLTSTGFKEFELYVVSSNEIYPNYSVDLGEIE